MYVCCQDLDTKKVFNHNTDARSTLSRDSTQQVWLFPSPTSENPSLIRVRRARPWFSTGGGGRHLSLVLDGRLQSLQPHWQRPHRGRRPRLFCRFHHPSFIQIRIYFFILMLLKEFSDYFCITNLFDKMPNKHCLQAVCLTLSKYFLFQSPRKSKSSVVDPDSDLNWIHIIKNRGKKAKLTDKN